MVAIPQSSLLAKLDRSGCAWGIPARFLQSTAARASRASLPYPHFPMADAGVCLLFCWGSYCWVCNLLAFIIYLFFLPAMLPSVFPRLATDSAGIVFPGVWNRLFVKSPSQDGLPFPGRSSLPTSFVSFLIFYILSYLFLKTMVCFSGCLMSSASLQKLFCGFCSALKCSFEEFVREKVVFLSYSSAIFF